MNETKQLITELHKPVAPVKRFRAVRVNAIDDTWAIDLMEMSPDDGYKYVLVCEDVFSRYIWIRPLKTKDMTATWNAMSSILAEAKTKPNKLWSDQGGEFYNAVWKKHLANLQIELYSTYSDWGVAPVESAIRTLKNWMMPLLEQQGSLAWMKLLPQVVDRYNTQHKHSALQMTPQQARNPAVQQELLQRMYVLPEPMTKPPKFAVGDWVRVARKKDVFEKGYDARWSYQPFQIVRVDIGDPVVYYLQEGNGEEVKGAFYENELQRTSVRDAVLIQEVLKRGKNNSLVRFRGFPKGYEQELPNSVIKTLANR